MLAEDVSIIEKAEGIQEKPITSYRVKLGIDNHWKWKWKSLSRVLLFATSWTIQFIEFSRPELEWETVSFSKGSSKPGIKPRSPALQVDSLSAELPGKRHYMATSLVCSLLSHLLCKGYAWNPPYKGKAVQLTLFSYFLDLLVFGIYSETSSKYQSVDPLDFSKKSEWFNTFCSPLFLPLLIWKL